MKVAIVGSNGQLGSDLVQAFADHGDMVCALTHADVDISSCESVRTALENENVSAVVNTAAMHHVENCERDPAAAYSVNAIGARNLALVTRDLGACLIHISTDYVFDGKKTAPYIEEDSALPLNVYGNSKLAGECYVRTINAQHFVVRTSALYGAHQCRAKGGRNFVELMLELARTKGQVRVVNDEFVSPTPTRILSHQIVQLGHCDHFGLYHATSEGSCSWYEFAREIFDVAGVKVQLDMAGASDFPMKTPRPRYSVLENEQLKKFGLNLFGPWQDGLRQYLTEGQLLTAANARA
ncbi:MAG TPA: dTDP-4-dehydrorhamnose reductase [Candidatus Eisenbacteria bacterium]|nr:dTDP-4-dehydrorhamnose reductase [Candidatus Eisenbacteria bacterium]